jgi:transposase
MTEEIILKIEKLAEKVQELETMNLQLVEENRWLKEQFLMARHKQFGASSERAQFDSNQCVLLFNEAEAILDKSPAEALDEKTVTYTRKRKTVGHREEVLSELPTETIDYRLSEEEMICACCGGQIHEMSSQTRDELAIIPAQVKVIKHVTHIYSCRHCELNEISTPIVKAPSPDSIIKKSLASPSAIAHIMGMKYVESMPLYRIEKHFAHFGVELTRAVLSNWVIKGAEMFIPIYNRMKEHLLDQEIMHADETTLQVLREDGRKAQSKSFMWLYRTGREGPPIVLYEYQPTREGDHAKRFLAGFAGALHVDGYAGYHKIPGVVIVGCMAHSRRKFVDAQKILPEAERNRPDHLTNIALGYINDLFKIEEDLANVTPAERKAARELRSKPILDVFKAWLDVQIMRVLPKSALGKAMAYTLGQWSNLIVYLTDGRLEISNNRAERSIKPFVIGRKNWLFANTPRGARTSAIIYSIVETAKENGLNPYAYLEYALEHLRKIDPADKSAIDALIPWNASVQAALSNSATPSAKPHSS